MRCCARWWHIAAFHLELVGVEEVEGGTLIGSNQSDGFTVLLSFGSLLCLYNGLVQIKSSLELPEVHFGISI